MSGTSVALSGGGHRATVFGLGVLLYLSDSGVSGDVSSVTSVSGGSITNGYLAQQLDFARSSKEEFRRQVAAPLAEQIALRGTLFAPWRTKLYLGLVVLVFLASVAGPWFLPAPVWLRLVVFAVGLLLSGWLVAQRGNICGSAYRITLLTSPDGSPTLLENVDRSLLHVCIATDLRTARQLYMSPRFVYGYGFGWSEPGALTVAKAVQASTAFPGGFPPARISRGLFQFKDTRTGEPADFPSTLLVLGDGGLYDNMAEQWARGFPGRVERWDWLKENAQAPETLVVVNSSGRKPWTPFSGRLPWLGELQALMRDMNVMYENTTAVRRQDLVAEFDVAARSQKGLEGALVMIRQSPYDVAGYFASEEGRAAWPECTKRAQRAEQVLELLGYGEENRKLWKGIARCDSEVPTTLRALGVPRTAQLLRHAWVLAMCNLHVILGWPLLELLPESHFEELARGEPGRAPEPLAGAANGETSD